MKHKVRKNQVIITALALIIAVAGYISYTQSDLLSGKNSAKATNEKEESATEETASENLSYDLSEEDLANNSIFTDTEESVDAAQKATDASDDAKETDTAQSDAAKTDAAKNDAAAKSSDSTTDSVAAATSDDAGQTVLASTDTSATEFASNVKMTREQVRSKNKSALLDIVNNTSISDAQKKQAIAKMIAMTETAEKENAAEILLEAKGFTQVVVSMSEDGADVVLNMGEVTDGKRAQVEEIVKRKTGVSADKIVITPLKQKTTTK